MTEKRFELTVSRKNNGVSIIDNSNNNSTLFFVSYIVLDDTLLVRNHLKPVVDKLNELHEKNEQLKQDGGYWAKTAEARRKEIDKLKEENKQFKKVLRVAYSTNLTEPSKNTIEQIAKYCGVDLE